MTANWRGITRYEPLDFHSEWAAASHRNEIWTGNAPVVARGRDTEWVETPNEHRIGMLVGRQVGFPTMGSSLSKVEIPVGCHTGKQQHGEEAIHILAGSGFLVLDGRRYDFHAGTTIHVPFMSVHQLFNTGDEVVSYISAATHDLDLFVMLGRFNQLEEKGTNAPGFEAAFPAEDGQYDELGRRIALHLEDAPDEEKLREQRRAKERAEGKGGHEGHGHGHGHGHGDGGDKTPDDELLIDRGKDGGASEYVARRRNANINENAHRHGAIYVLMGGGESKSDIRNDFTAVSVAMTNIFEEVPHTSSHCHTHTEAVLYVLEGVGFSEIDFEHYDWEAGDAVHVPPRMTRHEHFNPSDGRTRTLRIEFGIRYYYEPLWRGFEKVEHRANAQAIPQD
jgi:uncharacterized cupin superfamily protein